MDYISHISVNSDQNHFETGIMYLNTHIFVIEKKIKEKYIRYVKRSIWPITRVPTYVPTQNTAFTNTNIETTLNVHNFKTKLNKQIWFSQKYFI